MKHSVLLILVLNSFISAQWAKFPQLPARDIYTAYFDGSNIYAGGDSLIYISSNSGDDWHSAALIPGEAVRITEIIKINGAMLAGTYGQGVLRSTDNGSSWQEFNNGLEGYSKYIVTFLKSGDSLFTGSDGGGVYFMNLKADTLKWQSYNEGLGSNIAYTVKSLCRSGNNLILSAGASGYYYIRPLNASEWTERYIHPLKVPNVNSFIAAGDTVFAATVRGIYRSNDNGYMWDSVGIYAMPVQPTHFALDKGRVYVGYNRGYDFFIWYSDDRGSTWKVQDHQFMSLYNLYARDGKIWAATDQGLLYFMTDPTGTDKDKSGSSISFALHQNYPNPFNPETVISFSLSEQSEVKLTVHDALGREAAVLFEGQMNKGQHRIKFNASSLASGIYFCRLKAGGRMEVKKMVFLR